jgi:hypothetical protein
MSKFDSHLSALKALYNEATEALGRDRHNQLVPAEDFAEFRKIPRLNRDIVITEKIDGTNAQIFIEEYGAVGAPGAMERDGDGLCVNLELDPDKPARFVRLRAGQRTRWATPERDNMGFAAWAFKNAEELALTLGVGRHYGEWWGPGIQRKYGLTEKRFSLFNVHKWGARTYKLDPRCVRPNAEVEHKFFKGQQMCDCSEERSAVYLELKGGTLTVVPTLYKGPWFIERLDGTRVFAPDAAIDRLKSEGSHAAPGFMDPEGIVVFHEAGGLLFKVTCKNDEKPKGSTE